MRRCLLTLLCGTFFLAGCGKKPVTPAPPPLVKVQAPRQVSIDRARQRYAATLQPYTQTNMAFENSAYVESILMVPRDGGAVLVDQGDAVTAGTVLARQDDSEFAARVASSRANVETSQAKVAEAQAQRLEALAQEQEAVAGVVEAQENYRAAVDKVAEAKAQVRTSIANLAKADAKLIEDRKSYDRANVLYHEGAMIKPEWDRAVADFETAIANVAAARSQIAGAEADAAAARAQAKTAQAQIAAAKSKLESAQEQVQAANDQVSAAVSTLAGARANLERAEVVLSHCTLVAPYDSVVVNRNVSVGSLAGPATTAFTLADIRRMKAVFGVPDVEVDMLNVGQEVKLMFDAFPNRLFRERITNISPSADSKGKVFDVAVMLGNADRKLKNGMIANIELIHPGPSVNALVLPLSALTRSPRNMDAYAVVIVSKQDGKEMARVQDVHIGQALGNEVEITKGITAQDRVVVEGSNMVPDGGPVEVEH